LVELGANPRAQDDEPIVRAAAHGHLAVLNRLVELGVNPRARDDEPILGAAENGHLAVVNRLVELGAQVDRLTPEQQAWLQEMQRFSAQPNETLSLVEEDEDMPMESSFLNPR
jgi:ankyrin repeat protein